MNFRCSLSHIFILYPCPRSATPLPPTHFQVALKLAECPHKITQGEYYIKKVGHSLRSLCFTKIPSQYENNVKINGLQRARKKSQLPISFSRPCQEEVPTSCLRQQMSSSMISMRPQKRLSKQSLPGKRKLVLRRGFEYQGSSFHNSPYSDFSQPWKECWHFLLLAFPKKVEARGEAGSSSWEERLGRDSEPEQLRF